MVTRGKRGSTGVFVVGCAVGVTLALVLCYAENAFFTAFQKTRDRVSQKMYTSIPVKKTRLREIIDYEDLLYGSPNYSKTEADALKDTVRVTCILFVKDDRKAISARDTWGSHCNDLIFFGPPKNYSIPVIQIQAKSSWHFLCETIRILWTSRKKNIQWVLFLPETQFAIPENLRLYVSAFNHRRRYYMGHAIKFWGESYNVAQAGYVLSKGTIEAVIKNFHSSDRCISGGKFWKNEDYYLGKHLGELGIYPEDTRDALGRGRFHGYNFNQLLFPGKISSLGSYWTKSIYPVKEGRDCCSDYSITFHGTEPDKIYQHNYLIYQLKVFFHGGHVGNRPAPTPFPEDYVWKNFLTEEGIEDREVSSEEFYNIWKEKISGPAQFNSRLREDVKHFNSSHIFQSILMSSILNVSSASEK